MNNELENIILTIDTREQNQRRIKAVENWGESLGAIVEHKALTLCDYRLIGEFRGVSVNLGIEAKSLSDFCSCDYIDLKRKLFDSFNIYDEVALFIEVGNYTFKIQDGKTIIDNPAVRDGSADVCSLAQLEGCGSTLAQYGVHVRQLRSEAQFPYSIENLLSYIINPDHQLVKRPVKENIRRYKLSLLSAATPFQVKKLIKAYPNWSWLASASEESFKQILGKKAGENFYEFIRCHELETKEWLSGHYHLDGTDVLMCPYESKPCDEVNAYQCIGEICIHHPSHLPEVSSSIPNHPSGGSTLQSLSIKQHFNAKEHLQAMAHADTSVLDTHDTPSHALEATSKRIAFKPPSNADTPSHPGDFFTSHEQKSGSDPQISSKSNTTVSAEKVGEFPGFSPTPPTDDYDLGLNDKPLECVVICRHCHQTIIPEQDDDSGFCKDPECITSRKKSITESTLMDKLKIYLREPHSIEEIVKEYGCTAGYSFQMCMGGVKSGYLKKITTQSRGTMFQRIT